MYSEKGTEKHLAIHIQQNIAEHTGDITTVGDPTTQQHSLMEKQTKQKNPTTTKTFTQMICSTCNTRNSNILSQGHDVNQSVIKKITQVIFKVKNYLNN